MSLHPENKTCDLCLKTSDTEYDLVTFGDWMSRSGITVHYFCLLLSTNLPQRGGDTAGILGFLVHDIRKEINRAKKRKCMYCKHVQASIACHVCKKFFHLGCGNCYGALFQFCGEFRSYCDQCAPMDYQMLGKKWPLDSDERCYICQDHIDNDSPIKCIRARCCGNGFVHRQCLRKYALTSGYYLRCIWCGSKEFRDFVRTQGIFVPDRDAQWEREKNAYAELHKGHSRCNMETCCCPKGRDYSGGRWSIILCSLCGSFGAHNPNCLPFIKNKKQKVTEFKCETCQN